MKKGTVILWLTILFSGILSLFWYYDWKYNLPTPIPINYKIVPHGSLINLKTNLSVTKKKPQFLHFFNPLCPCSRFNITHFKSLVREYANDIDFKIVVITDKKYTEKEIQDKFDINLPVLFDSSVAIACGVYSTPQAVLIDNDDKLYYRGNYNRTRYCSDKKTEYARIALENYVHNSPASTFDQFALKAYGCQLPKCNK